METMTWEQFKEQMDYFREVLKSENLTEETKQEINEGMQRIVRYWTTPVITISVDRRKE